MTCRLELYILKCRNLFQYLWYIFIIFKMSFEHERLEDLHQENKGYNSPTMLLKSNETLYITRPKEGIKYEVG